MSKYRSYEDAKCRGKEDVWPGCGIVGRCMPCGAIHNFDRTNGGRRIDHYQCSRNHSNGCPYPKPEPVHNFNHQGRCSRCGARDPRPRLSPAQIRLLRRAVSGGRDRADLYGGEFSVAAALERRGLARRIIEPDRIELTDKGLDAAVLLGLIEAG